MKQFSRLYVPHFSIDFGIPGHFGFDFDDGNHRLAAAIILDKKYILAHVSGAESEIKKFLYE